MACVQATSVSPEKAPTNAVELLERFTGVASHELQDLDVLGRVHLHQLDEQWPEALVLQTLQFRGQLLELLASSRSRPRSASVSFSTEAASDPQVPMWGTAGASESSSTSLLRAEARSRKTLW